MKKKNKTKKQNLTLPRSKNKMAEIDNYVDGRIPKIVERSILGKPRPSLVKGKKWVLS